METLNLWKSFHDNILKVDFVRLFKMLYLQTTLLCTVEPNPLLVYYLIHMETIKKLLELIKNTHVF